jgi:hypothetical protein
MVDFGLVPVVGRQRPRHEAYLDWLAGHLIRPQTAYIIDSVILFDRDIILPELARAVSRYNATAREPIPLTNSRRGNAHRSFSACPARD